MRSISCLNEIIRNNEMANNHRADQAWVEKLEQLVEEKGAENPYLQAYSYSYLALVHMQDNDAEKTRRYIQKSMSIISNHLSKRRKEHFSRGDANLAQSGRCISIVRRP